MPVAHVEPCRLFAFLLGLSLFSVPFSSAEDFDFCSANNSIDATSGVIYSPNHPSNYTHNARCHIYIKVGAGPETPATLRLHVIRFETERTHDYLRIQAEHGSESFSGSQNSGPSLIAGRQYDFVWNGEIMDLYFRSDSSVAKQGFQLQFVVLNDFDVIRFDRSKETAAYSGVISSPNYPGAYNNSVDVDVFLSLKTTSPISQMTVRVSVETFATEPCCDFLSVFTSGGIERLGGTLYAGLQYWFFSSTSPMRLNFKTDGSVVRPGFRLHYSFVEPASAENAWFCSSYTPSLAFNGNIFSPGFPGNYGDDVDCTIRIPLNRTSSQPIDINVRVLAFRTEAGYDFLRIEHDGGLKSFSGSFDLVGNSANRVGVTYTFSSSSSYFLLHFVSDSSVNRTGFYLQYRVLGSRDSCAQNADMCAQICTNTLDSYICSCMPGYIPLDNGRQCIDLDECAQNLHQCQQNCTNTIGSYSCNCFSGFKQADNGTCVDEDECAQNLHQCQQNCTNTIGSYSCDCFSGFKQADNRTCVDVDECAQTLHQCQQKCTNTIGSHSCDCFSGFKQADNGTCVDIDECMDTPTLCELTCTNTIGSYSCACSDGLGSSATGQCGASGSNNIPLLYVYVGAGAALTVALMIAVTVGVLCRRKRHRAPSAARPLPPVPDAGHQMEPQSSTVTRPATGNRVRETDVSAPASRTQGRGMAERPGNRYGPVVMKPPRKGVQVQQPNVPDAAKEQKTYESLHTYENYVQA